MYSCDKETPDMINLSGIGHVLLRVADEEASKRFYRDVLGFRIAEQDPEHGGVFMTLGDGFHTIDLAQHPTPQDAPRPRHGQLGLAHIAFKVASYAALREAYAHLLKNGVEIQRRQMEGAVDVAREMGIKVPQELLYRADEMIR
jgi:catechol 2,3-dioxygenase-like lactoylglutathione lyase family enzyme